MPQLDWKLCVGEDKEVETQFDVFLIIGTEGEICGPNIADFFLEPPSSVYHPVKGMGIYYHTSQTPDLTEKYYCYKLIHKGHT